MQHTSTLFPFALIYVLHAGRQSVLPVRAAAVAACAQLPVVVSAAADGALAVIEVFLFIMFCTANNRTTYYVCAWVDGLNYWSLQFLFNFIVVVVVVLCYALPRNRALPRGASMHGRQYCVTQFGTTTTVCNLMITARRWWRWEVC